MTGRQKKRKQGEVELNLAAMLDMAFQLLTFFILTFRPAPIEGQVDLHLPPPRPVTNVSATEVVGANPENSDPAVGMRTLVINAVANDDGALRQIAIGESSMGTTAALERKLTTILSDPGTGFEQVLLQVDGRLNYDELMRLVDVCTRQKLADGQQLTKLSFVEAS